MIRPQLNACCTEIHGQTHRFCEMDNYAKNNNNNSQNPAEYVFSKKQRNNNGVCIDLPYSNNLRASA